MNIVYNLILNSILSFITLIIGVVGFVVNIDLEQVGSVVMFLVGLGGGAYSLINGRLQKKVLEKQLHNLNDTEE